MGAGIAKASFDDGIELLADAEKIGFEGAVWKGRDALTMSGWMKAKTQAWREANSWRLFQRQ
jgi:hypothetical protein